MDDTEEMDECEEEGKETATDKAFIDEEEGDEEEGESSEYEEEDGDEEDDDEEEVFDDDAVGLKRKAVPKMGGAKKPKSAKGVGAKK